MTAMTDECLQLIGIKRRYNAPIIPRVLILGPRGSGRKTQAKLLAKKFNLIYSKSNIRMFISPPPRFFCFVDYVSFAFRISDSTYYSCWTHAH